MSLLASWTEYEGDNWEKQHDDDENEGNGAGNDIKWNFSSFSLCFFLDLVTSGMGFVFVSVLVFGFFLQLGLGGVV